MLKVKNVGKPDEGKLHVRFDEEGLVCPCPLLYQDVSVVGIQKNIEDANTKLAAL